ncbi:hypothetical protein [Cyclobacterium salsum]|uniref:hypothetical protein n=1 Tax=Cyclobacterium salsum TaxID=2666329 RepID=UPI0013909B61|nr:hypothetical protein [Cyclobacterium salsum]
MKTFLAILLLSGSIFPLLARQIQVEEPEFSGIVLLMRNDQQAEPLEKQKASSGSKANIGAALFGVAKARGMNLVDGAKSPVRVSGVDKVRLLVKADGNSRDPVEMINVFLLEADPDKNRRIITTGTVNFNKTTAAAIDFIPFTGSKYRESSYLLELDPLPPGEYAVTLEGSRDVFNLFGVDPY